MKKYLVCLFLGLLRPVGPARAQAADYTPLSPTPARCTAPLVPAYRSWADTARPALYLSGPGPERVVGARAPAWAVVQRGAARYFVPRRFLAYADEAAVPRDAASQRVAYTGVVAVPQAPAGELFRRAKIWLAAAVRGTQPVVQAEDPGREFLVGRGYAPIAVRAFGTATPLKLYYSLTLNFQDGRCRYALTDFYTETEPAVVYHAVAASAYPAVRTPLERVVSDDPKTGFLPERAQYKAELTRVVQELTDQLQTGLRTARDF